jgi:hypothetical protein
MWTCSWRTSPATTSAWASDRAGYIARVRPTRALALLALVAAPAAMALDGDATSEEAPEHAPAPPATDPALGTEAGRTPAALAALQQASRHLPIGERVAALSAPWMGAPYTNGPLGELTGIDPDPQIRYDTFDCLTFIEEVFALALSSDAVDAQRVRMGLRYRGGGPTTYENRRHFMLAEWIPGVVEDGWFTDITADFEGAVRVAREVTAGTWAAWWGRSSLQLEDARLPVGEQSFWYLPLDAALAQLSQIPPGTVVFFMRQPADHIPIAVTHVGVIVPGDDTPMRHASKRAGRLWDEPLGTYIGHQRVYQKWPLTGLILLAPQDYGPRPLKPPEEL